MSTIGKIIVATVVLFFLPIILLWGAYFFAFLWIAFRDLQWQVWIGYAVMFWGALKLHNWANGGWQDVQKEETTEAP